MSTIHDTDVKAILPFEDLDRASIPIAGGKAANLGESIRAGLPVPAGFCVTTAAYELVSSGADLAPSLIALAETPPDDTARLAEIAAQIRADLLAAPIPDALARSITAAYLELGDGATVPVAVRSSATAEDLPFASFAGQQDTYLNIVGAEAVLDAVRNCWASLWTDRAVRYRATNGIDPRSVRLAVAVQRMVAAEVAGVLFTANPLTGRRHQAVIDASLGLGEAVVSGMVNPDHFVVNTATGEIVERRLGDKRVAIRATEGNGTQRVEMDGNKNEACLSDEQVRALAKLGARVEAHYEAPQDTEPDIGTHDSPVAAEGILSGTPASGGVVSARARVILDPGGAHLEPGEILVAPSTDPGWTPLFLTAGGLVMEMGGPMSHGAIVAREYGIPAVVGVPDAIERITTGQRITVDGSAGTISTGPQSDS